MSSHCPGTMVGVLFLLSNTYATGMILSSSTQILLGPILLVLNALGTPFLGRSHHFDVMWPTLPQE